MATDSTNSVTNSLRGRILIATGALVVLCLICGLVGYLATSFLAATPVYALVGSMIGMSGAIVVFGWWMSKELLRPIETVALLARTLERSQSASLPKTTGAAETDEVLQTLHRNSQQLQNLIGLMDDVSNGKTDAAMAPLQNPDRLSVSFQKLVSKVTESIEAKQLLDTLQASVNRLKAGLGDIRRGDFKFEATGDLRQVEDIAEALKLLTGRLGGTLQQVTSSSNNIRESAEEARRSLRGVIEIEEMQSMRLKKAASSLVKSPGTIRDLSGKFASSLDAFSSEFRVGESYPEPAAQNASVEVLRKHLAESVKHLSEIRERANAIPQSARAAGELARRANLLSVNTSLQADSKNAGASIIAGEIASISTRAEVVNKEILSLNESLTGDFAQLESALSTLSSDIAAVSVNTTRSSNALMAVEKHLANFSGIQLSLSAYADDHVIQHDALIKVFEAATDTGVIANIKDVEQTLLSLIGSAEGLLDAVSKLKAGGAGKSSDSDSVMSPAGAMPAAVVGLQGEN